MKFSKKSEQKLKECDIKLQDLFYEVIKKTPIDFGISCGHRTLAVQKEMYEKGTSKVLKGKHNESPSQAIDIYAYDKGLTWDKEYYYFLGGFICAEAKRLGINIRWGGNWDGDGSFKDQTFNDLCHFELT